MSDDQVSLPEGGRPRQKGIKGFWKRHRKALMRSPIVTGVLVRLIAGAIRLIDRTNRPVTGSHDMTKIVRENAPAIAALWHGQHILAPTLNPPDHRLVALFSRSADAELNALVAEKLGVEIVRGSGGRGAGHDSSKGGARALIKLKRSLDAGKSVALIADISKGTPRQAGLGIVTLAKISGRPIFPVAIATSRRKVLQKSWDKTTINLPFGRRALIVGNPVHVGRACAAEELELKRRELTDGLNAATSQAYALVDGAT